MAEAVRVAAIPRRPAWADSNPRWRRRMVAGAWVLVLVPLVDVLRLFGLSDIPIIPVFWEPQFSLETLDNTFFSMVYDTVPFCVGIVLLFSKERFRRRNKLDWTRRWGVLMSYVVLFLAVPACAPVTCLVLIGIAASFFTLPPANQPGFTGFLADVAAAYVYYGPQMKDAGYYTLAAMSAGLVLLACVPIHTAVRCSGPRWVAFVLLTPLAVIAAWTVAIAGSYLVYLTRGWAVTNEPPLFFFAPYYLTAFLHQYLNETFFSFRAGYPSVSKHLLIIEAAKWLSCLGIALWLSVAQLRAWRRPKPIPPPAADV